MAEKDLHHRLTGDSSSLEGAMRRGARSMSAAEREAKRLEIQQQRTRQAMADVGKVMLAAGAAIAAGIGLSVRAAIRWESAWAGVAKVLADATEPQLAILEGQLRSLARELPQSHEQIAAVAAAAGQLGVAAPDIAAFTRTMIDLGVATNLTSEEAAFALARMSSIMGTARDDVGRMGAAIVELGNNSATTESDIVQMALRISGAGKAIGLTEAEVLGFSAALSSVGIAAQAGGTAVSRAFMQIDGAVRNGGQELDRFAQVAGMTAEDFRRAYQQDAAGAIATFVEGLGRIQTSGGDVFKTLETLGFTEIRLRDALLRLAGAGDILSRSIDTGNRGWDENRALMDEVARRYGTVEARVAIAKNQLNDFGISIGQTLLPAVGAMADTLGAFVGMLNDLPGPAKTAVAIVGTLAAIILLAGGTALVAIPRIHQMRVALDQLALAGGRAAAAVGVFRAVASFLAGPWGIAIGLGIAAVTAFGLAQAKTDAQVKDLSGTLSQQSGAVTENTRLWIANELASRKASGIFQKHSGQQRDFVDNLDAANVSMATAVEAVTGNAAAMQELTSRHAELTAAVEETGDAKYLERVALRELIAVIEEEADQLDKAIELQRLLTEGTGQATDATSRLEPEVRNVAAAFGASAEEAEILSGQLSDLDKELRALFDSVFGLTRAEDELTLAFRKLIEQVEQATEAGDENATALDGNSDAAIKNRRAIEDLIEKHADVIVKMKENGATNEEVAEATDAFRAELLKVAGQLGLNEDELSIYLGLLDDIPAVVSTTVSLDVSRAQQQLAEWNARVGAGSRRPEQFHQHGGWVRGPSTPVDAVPVRATGGEFIVRRDVAQRHGALLDTLNTTGRVPVMAVPGTGGGGDGVSAPVYHIHLSAYSSQFSLAQVQDDLAFRGVS